MIYLAGDNYVPRFFMLIMKRLFFLLIPILFVGCGPDGPKGGGGLASQKLRDGITRISDDSLAFVLYAPHKNMVHLIGDFNDWEVSDEYKMRKDGDRFWIKIGGLNPSQEYVCQYLIDGAIRVADPYTTKISDPWNDKYISPTIYPNLIGYPEGKTDEIAMVVSTANNTYTWAVPNYVVGDTKKLTIYELLIRDFTTERSIKAVEAKLPYLKSLGVNAIELMPFNEFEGNDSWGYNPAFYFATDKAYGTSEDYKDFIDACHQNGMAVIMDMVLNHSYGQSPMVRMWQSGSKIASNNPYYNVDSPNQVYSWGYDFNHESKVTQNFVDSVNAYWITEYKVDGFRFDFTKGFTNKPGDGWAFDQSRIDILKRMTDEIRKRKSDAIVILEHLADNSEETILADYGILLWGNTNYAACEAAMGWGEEIEGGGKKGDFSWASYKARSWNRPSLVAYNESHDEERVAFKTQKWGATPEIISLAGAMQRAAAVAVVQFSIPGPKMMWQFGEMGYDVELNGNESQGNGRLHPKPPHWEYLDVPERAALHDVYVKMIDLRKNNPIFTTGVFTTDLVNNFKVILLKDQSSVTQAVIMANLDIADRSKTIAFGTTGTWTDYFTDATLNVTTTSQEVTLAGGEYRIYFKQ